MNESAYQSAVTQHRSIRFERPQRTVDSARRSPAAHYRFNRDNYAVSAKRRGPLSYGAAHGGAATGTLFEPAFRGEQVLQAQTAFIRGLKARAFQEVPAIRALLSFLSCRSCRMLQTTDITGRFGVVVDRALVYVKGGVVWTDSDYSAFTNIIGTLSTSASDTRISLLFGAGVEYAFALKLDTRMSVV